MDSLCEFKLRCWQGTVPLAAFRKEGISLLLEDIHPLVGGPFLIPETLQCCMSLMIPF